MKYIFIILMFLTGCTTIQKNKFTLLPTQNGLIKFNTENGETYILFSQDGRNLQWMKIDDLKTEINLNQDLKKF